MLLSSSSLYKMSSNVRLLSRVIRSRPMRHRQEVIGIASKNWDRCYSKLVHSVVRKDLAHAQLSRFCRTSTRSLTSNSGYSDYNDGWSFGSSRISGWNLFLPIAFAIFSVTKAYNSTPEHKGT